jgi:hypothetical protein
MADLEKFRTETRQWLLENSPTSVRGLILALGEGNWGGRKATYANPDMKRWLEVMAARGWTASEWPTQYGGAVYLRRKQKSCAKKWPH